MKKKQVKKEVKVEYFTDEMHKEIYPFQESFKGNKNGGKPFMKALSLSKTKK